MTTPDIQAILNQQVYRMIFDGKPITLGETTAPAKAVVTDGDVRRTWILLGDPLPGFHGKENSRAAVWNKELPSWPRPHPQNGLRILSADLDGKAKDG